MTQQFDPRRNQIILNATLIGPADTVNIRLLLDTGAAFTLILPKVLKRAGYSISTPRAHIRIASLTSVTNVPLYIIDGLSVFGHRAGRLAVLGHTLPVAAHVDGLLGVNFLRGHRLLLDFRDGVVRFDEDG